MKGVIQIRNGKNSSAGGPKIVLVNRIRDRLRGGPYDLERTVSIRKARPRLSCEQAPSAGSRRLNSLHSLAKNLFHIHDARTFSHSTLTTSHKRTIRRTVQSPTLDRVSRLQPVLVKANDPIVRRTRIPVHRPLLLAFACGRSTKHPLAHG